MYSRWTKRLGAMMMKLPLLLLVLSSASLQDNVEKSPQHRNVSMLNPDLDEKVPEISVNISTHRRILPPSNLKKKRQASSPMFNNGKLKWQAWRGSLPNGAVSMYNNYEGRIDYVCKRGCHSGFYNPDMGSYCNYPYGYEEHRTSSFEILVNEDNFEILEWKDDSHGSVPQNSVRTCSSDILYVAQNKYGLGKVHPKYGNFYLPWKGVEYEYKDYQVLTISTDVESENIYNVIYNTNRAEIVQDPPKTMRVSAVTNNDCNLVSQTTTLSKTDRVENRWDWGASIMLGIKKTFSAGVPFVVSGAVELSAELSFQVSLGNTMTEEVSHSVSVELKVPPNYHCKVRMVGRKYKVNIPFTAHVSRTYSDGKTTQTSITGTYNSIQVGDVHAEVDRCTPVSGAQPCPKMT